MGFDSGPISCQRYAVVGQCPSTPTDQMLEQIKSQLLTPSDMGLPAEVEYGWCGPRHVLDRDIDFGNCVFNDCVWFALRIDTNRAPAELKQAWLAEIETAAAKNNPSGFISKQQKKIAKDDLARKIDDELRSGKHRRQKLIPVLWDVPAGILYGPTSKDAREKLSELFSRTFDLELHTLTSGNVAMNHLEGLGKRRQYEDFTPTRFARSPEDPDAPAEYPWTAKGDGAKDFLGNEFLLWMWYEAAHRAGAIYSQIGEATVMFDRTLQLDCVFNHTGKETITAAGPTRLPEAFEALRTGKVPRRAGLIIDWAGGQYNLVLTGESLAMSGLKLPEIDDADTPRTFFEERITLLRDFDKLVQSLFFAFLKEREQGWEPRVKGIRDWIVKASKRGDPTVSPRQEPVFEPVEVPKDAADTLRTVSQEHMNNAIQVSAKMLDLRDTFKRVTGDKYVAFVDWARHDIKKHMTASGKGLMEVVIDKGKHALEEQGNYMKMCMYAAAAVEMCESSKAASAA